MPFAGSHAAPEIERGIYDHVRRMNASRHVPQMLPMLKEISEKNRVYIFNVGPWMQQRPLGSAGTWTIPACPEGKEYSDPVVIDGLVREMYPDNEAQMKSLGDVDGMEFAMQILGVGPHLSPRNSFIPFGIFASRNQKPTKAEIDEARGRLRETFRELVAEADRAYAQGPKLAEETIRPETHFVAARALRKSEAECPWLKNAQAPAARDSCPSCGGVYNVGIMKCRDCGYILDKKRYDEAVKAGLFAA